MLWWMGKDAGAMWPSLHLSLSHKHTLLIIHRKNWGIFSKYGRNLWPHLSALSSPPPSLTLSNSLSLALLSFSAEVGWIPAQAEEIMQQHPIFRPCLIIWASPLHSAALASARSITGCMCYFIFFLLDLIVVKERTGFLFPVTSLPMLVVFRAAWERERPLWNEHVLMNILSPLYARNLY